ncbi:MAG: MFS transporter [Acidimicrobiia bacterium]
MHTLSTLRTFTSDSRRFLASAFLWGFAFSVTWLYLNFLFESLGFSASLVGAANAIPNMVAIVLALPVARLAERLGFIRSLQIAAVMAGAGLIVLGFVEQTGLVIMAVTLVGIGGMAFWVVPSPLMTVLEPAANRTYLFSTQFAAQLIAGFLGSLIGGQMPNLFARLADIDPKSLQAIQWTVVLSGFLYMLAALPLRNVTEVKPDEPGQGRLWHIPREARHVFVKLLAPNALIGLGAGLIIPFLNLFVEGKFGVAFSTLGAVFAWSQLGMALAVMTQPLIADRLGKVASIVLVQALSLPFIAMLGFSSSFAAVAIALFVRSALMNAANPIYAAFTMEQVKDGWRPSLAAAENMVWATGWVIGPVASGLIRDWLGFERGFPVLFGAMLVLYAAGITYSWLVLRPLEKAAASRLDRTEPPVS